MLNAKTIFFPFAELDVPPSNAKQAGEVVVVEKPEAAFTAVPAKEVSSVAADQVLEPDVPFK